MLPTKTGTYLGRVTSKIGVEQKDSGAVQAVIQFALDQYLPAGGGAEDVHDVSITAYLVLFGTNANSNKINDINIRSLKDSLGWDGASLSSLQETDFTDQVVQVVVAEEEYNGKKSMRVRFINPKDYAGGTGGVKQADPNQVKILDSKFGSMLRAAGGKPGQAARKATTSGTTATAGGTTVGKDMAWITFGKMVDEYNAGNPSNAYSEERRREVFKKVVVELAAPKQPASLTEGEWAQLAKELKESFSPAIGERVPF